MATPTELPPTDDAPTAPFAVPRAAETDADTEAERAFRRRLARGLASIAVFLFLSLGWLGITAGGQSAASVGTPLPPFELPLLSGGTLGHADLGGHVTVLNVWASWCPPCRSEAPVLRRVSEDVEPDGVRFLGVVRNDEPEPAAAFVADFDLDYPNVVDDGTLAGGLGVRGIPMTFIVDGTGTVFARHFGPISESRLRVLIEDVRSRSATALVPLNAAPGAPAAPATGTP